MGTNNGENINENKEYYPFRYGYTTYLDGKIEYYAHEIITTTTYQKNYVGESGVYLSRNEIKKAEKAFFIAAGIGFIIAAINFFINGGVNAEKDFRNFIVFCIPAGIITAIVYRIITMPIYKLVARCFKKRIGIDLGDFDWEDVIDCIIPSHRRDWIINYFKYEEMHRIRNDPSFKRTMKEKGHENEFISVLH